MNDARNSPKCTQRRSKNKITDVMIYEGDVLLSNGGGTDKHKNERERKKEGDGTFAVGTQVCRSPAGSKEGDEAKSLS